MDLSVVIVNWNVKELLDQLLDSIFRFTNGLKFEVIVVDNDSRDGSIEFLRQKFQNRITSQELIIVANNFNAGFSKANNQGLKLAKGEYVLFMNPDMLLLKNTFLKLLIFMKERGGVSACTCRLLDADKTIQPNVKNHPRLCDQILVLLKLHHFLNFLPCLRRYLAKDFDYISEQMVQQIMGAFFFVKRDFIVNLGGWDENYWLWWEDIDLCKTIDEQGGKIVFTPTTELIHFEGKSFAQTYGLKKQKRFNAGLLLYFKKHLPRWQYYVLYSLQPVSWLLTIGVQIFKIKPRPQSRV